MQKWLYIYIAIAFLTSYITTLCFKPVISGIILLCLIIGTITYVKNSIVVKNTTVVKYQDSCMAEQIKASKIFFTELLNLIEFALENVNNKNVDYDALQLSIDRIFSKHNMLKNIIDDASNVSIDVCVILTDLNRCMVMINDLYTKLDNDGTLEEIEKLSNMALMKIDLVLALISNNIDK